MAGSFVLISWRILNIDTVQFHHQKNEGLENKAYEEEVSMKPSSVVTKKKVCNNICEEKV